MDGLSDASHTISALFKTDSSDVTSCSTITMLESVPNSLVSAPGKTPAKTSQPLLANLRLS